MNKGKSVFGENVTYDVEENASRGTGLSADDCQFLSKQHIFSIIKAIITRETSERRTSGSMVRVQS